MEETESGEVRAIARTDRTTEGGQRRGEYRVALVLIIGNDRNGRKKARSKREIRIKGKTHAQRVTGPQPSLNQSRAIAKCTSDSDRNEGKESRECAERGVFACRGNIMPAASREDGRHGRASLLARHLVTN